jgi:hypothetical protein
MDELVSKAKGAVDLARHETADDGFADDHQGHLVAAVASYRTFAAAEFR